MRASSRFPPPAGSPAHQTITLGVGKSAVVELDTEAHDVLVSSPDIVDAVVRSPKRIFLLGLKTGQTNAFFFDGDGHQVLSLDIRVEKDVTDLATHDEGRSAQFGDQGFGDERQCGSVGQRRFGARNPPAPPIWRPASPAIPRRSSTCWASPAASR